MMLRRQRTPATVNGKAVLLREPNAVAPVTQQKPKESPKKPPAPKVERVEAPVVANIVLEPPVPEETATVVLENPPVEAPIAEVEEEVAIVEIPEAAKEPEIDLAGISDSDPDVLEEIELPKKKRYGKKNKKSMDSIDPLDE